MNIIKSIKDFFNAKVLLSDLDGTLIQTKSGKTFPENCEDWELVPRIAEAIKNYNPRYLFIISNQGGISQGYVNEREFQGKMRKIISELREKTGVQVIDYAYCTSNNTECYYRKPNVGMIDYFKHDYYMNYDFLNRDAMMIGDASGKEGQFSDSDKKCAENAGIKYMDVSDFIEKYDRTE